jgi:hypothetical protein
VVDDDQRGLDRHVVVGRLLAGQQVHAGGEPGWRHAVIGVVVLGGVQGHAEAGAVAVEAAGLGRREIGQEVDGDSAPGSTRGPGTAAAKANGSRSKGVIVGMLPR